MLAPSPPASRAAPADGLLDLTFGVQAGRTRLVASASRAPLMVQRALYLDADLPELATVFPANTTAGIFAGDRLETRVRALAGAQVHLTTPSAAKVFTMPDGEAHQHLDLHVADGALLEYLPDCTIPFAGADYAQTARVTVEPGATLVYGDLLVPGRMAQGELFAYRHLGQRLTIDDGGGRILYHEAYDLRPSERHPVGVGLLPATHPVFGTLVLVSPTPAPALLAAVRAALPQRDELRAGASLLPYQAGVSLRLVGASRAAVQAGITAGWAALRRLQFAAGITPTRKN